ncbi:MAG: CrcB family protein [Halolamina sp.]
MTYAGLVAVAVVGIGGSVGAVTRHAVGRAVGGRRATATVNVVGSFLLGVVSAASVGPRFALLAGTGFCGAFTTYSSFAVEVGGLLTDGDHENTVLFGFGTLLAAVTAVLLGRWLVGVAG